MNRLQRKIILALKRHRDYFSRIDVDLIVNRFLLSGHSPEDITFSMAEHEVINLPVREASSPSHIQMSNEYAYAKVACKF